MRAYYGLKFDIITHLDKIKNEDLYFDPDDTVD